MFLSKTDKICAVKNK